MAVTLPQVPLIFTQVSANGISGSAGAANQIKFCDFAKLAGGKGGRGKLLHRGVIFITW